MRLNKYIAESGFCSRKKADALIESKQVTINGKIASIGDQIRENDKVAINGQLISTKGKEDIYLAFHKPIGVITSSNKDADNTVFDYINIEGQFFAIGQLDSTSSGLLLLTNNRDVANKMNSSKYPYEIEYVVTIDKKMTRSFMDAMRNGVLLNGEKTTSARLRKVHDKKFHFVTTETKDQQITKMCVVLGYQVKTLKCIRVMNIKLRELGEGNWRYLSKNERRELLEAAD